MKNIFKITICTICILFCGLFFGEGLAKAETPLDNLFPNCAPRGIKCVPAEKKVYPELQKLIIDEFEIPEEFWEKTKYYYNYYDLNDDGKDEIIVVAMGPFTSGTGGSSGLIVEKDKNGKLKAKQALSLINTPILISNEMTNGYHDLVVYRAGGGATPEVVKLPFKKDGFYTSVNDGTKVENIKALRGVAIICNNLIKDNETGNFLTLASK